LKKLYKNETPEEKRVRLNMYKVEWKKRNPEKVKEQRKRYAEKHPETLAAKSKRYRERYPETIAIFNKKYREENPEFVQKLKKDWIAKNVDRINKKRRETIREKLSNDVKYANNYRLKLKMANSINKSLNGQKNKTPWENLVNYSLQDLMNHLENNFKPGMTWENRGKNGWHIDHKRPIASFNIISPMDENFRMCWALSNLQPLWEFENLSKGSKWEGIDHGN
jgi:hypothetical protein